MQARSETPGKQEVQCDWKEFTAPDGRKYYYNRVTKQSKWQIPEELKQAQAMVSVSKGASKPSSVQVKRESNRPIDVLTKYGVGLDVSRLLFVERF